ncbi:MAG: hypothetical protein ABEI52_08410, partial [Halobacteriaceae archaeon]
MDATGTKRFFTVEKTSLGGKYAGGRLVALSHADAADKAGLKIFKNIPPNKRGLTVTIRETTRGSSNHYESFKVRKPTSKSNSKTPGEDRRKAIRTVEKRKGGNANAYDDEYSFEFNEVEVVGGDGNSININNWEVRYTGVQKQIDFRNLNGTLSLEYRYLSYGTWSLVFSSEVKDDRVLMEENDRNSFFEDVKNIYENHGPGEQKKMPGTVQIDYSPDRHKLNDRTATVKYTRELDDEETDQEEPEDDNSKVFEFHSLGAQEFNDPEELQMRFPLNPNDMTFILPIDKDEPPHLIYFDENVGKNIFFDTTNEDMLNEIEMDDVYRNFLYDDVRTCLRGPDRNKYEDEYGPLDGKVKIKFEGRRTEMDKEGENYVTYDKAIITYEPKVPDDLGEQWDKYFHDIGKDNKYSDAV